MPRVRLLVSLSFVAALLGVLALSSPARATLIAQQGGAVVFDSRTGLTWLADANLAASDTFGLPVGVDLGLHPSASSFVQGRINADGTMNLPGAFFWIDAMNAANHLGFDTWRLPDTPIPDPGCTDQTFFQGFGCSLSDLGNLVYTSLGVVPGQSVLTGTPADVALFSGFDTTVGVFTWSRTPLLGNSLVRTYGFTMHDSRQAAPTRQSFHRGWAVVPEPAILGILVLAGAVLVRRRG